MTQIQLETLIQRAELHAGQFFAELRLMEQGLVRTDRASTALSANMTRSFKSPLVALTALRSGIGALAGALAVREVVQYANAYTQVQNQLRVAGVASGDMAAATSEIFDIAQRTRAPVAELAQLYSRVALSANSLGISQRQTAEFTELVGQAVAVAGTSTGAASGALLQLSQALGGSVIQMQEFNSLINGARPLLQAAAAGIIEAEGSVDKLRKMVLEGRLSGEEFFQGITAGADVIRARFATTIPTVAQAFTQLGNAATEAIGKIDQSTEGTRALVGAIQDLAESLGSPEFQQFAKETIGGIVEGVGTVIEAYKNWLAVVGRIQTALESVGAGGVADFIGMNDLERIQSLVGLVVSLTEKLAELKGSPVNLGDVLSGPAEVGVGIAQTLLDTRELTEAEREAEEAKRELGGSMPMEFGRDLGELVTTTERTTAAQRELLAVQKEICKIARGAQRASGRRWMRTTAVSSRGWRMPARNLGDATRLAPTLRGLRLSRRW